jgi:hypothetical protein
MEDREEPDNVVDQHPELRRRIKEGLQEVDAGV